MVSEALLSFSLTPVQRFIEAARTVRDLKAGSKLLSHLTWQALQAVKDAHGEPMFPTVNFEQGEPESIPNLFLARFQGDNAAQQAAQAAEQAENAVRERWRAVAAHVRAELGNRWGRGWAADWDEQIEGFWTITTVVLDAADARAVHDQMTGSTSAGPADLSTQFKAISGLLAARKMVRRFVADHGVGRHKCSVMGDLEQMGPVGLREADAFWGGVEGTRISPASIGAHDRLCAVSLVKRFCHCVPGVDGLSDEIPETAEVAAAHWWRRAMDKAPGETQGFADAHSAISRACPTAETQWRCLLTDDLTADAVCAGEPAVDVTAIREARDGLLGSVRHTLGAPPRYYGIIAFDGDHMGKWLSGEMTEQPVTEEFWRDVSGSLREYAQGVRGMVDDFGGYTVYAGGDDVLALNPLATALQCAQTLRDQFPQFGPKGTKTTASAGLAIVHYQHDLRAGLRAARNAEHAAKDAGRDRLGISLVKRSGGPVHLVIEWDQVPALMKLQALFAAGLSDRWLYKLAQTLPDLHPDLAPEALAAVVAHALKRIEIARKDATGLRRELGLSDDAGTDAIKQALRDHVEGQFTDWQRRAPGLLALDRFIKFGMIASFLHRGRD